MNLTERLQRRVSETLPYEELMPAEQPIYVHSYVYLFGIATVASFILLIVSGIILSVFGPQWWHSSTVGHFVNSAHFWSVQAFFFFMVLHLWTAFFSGAWRDGRGLTWVSGMVTFLVSILTAFTGYLSQQNFDAQWIGVQGKDALNAVGVGAFFDALNFGQMYGFHIAVLPVIVAGLVGLHLMLVRLRGVVRPYPLDVEAREGARAGAEEVPV
ncbi:MAG TPA: cytochrome b N-terminal domain-containing protein [Chloroflexota bacterium]|nr:cytochrome b N-terminal domain-containing protein [Chloroflexota bacterium]